MLIAVAAINADQSVPYCPLNAYKPIGRVLYLSDDVTISGQKKDFHEFTNVNIASDARPGFDIGRMILRKIASKKELPEHEHTKCAENWRYNQCGIRIMPSQYT